MAKVKVFVSYKWGVEERTKYVEQIERLCPQNNVYLIRDNNEIRHGDSIDEFMQQIAGGEHIIIVLSAEYLESDWCMYELLNIWRRGEFHMRSHLILDPNCNLQDINYRLQVVQYWEQKAADTRAKLEAYDLLNVSEEYKQLRVYRDVAQEINDILNFVRKLYTTPASELQKTNFQGLFDKIKASIYTKIGVQEDEEAASQAPPAFYYTIDHHHQVENFPVSSERLFIGAYAATARDYPLSVAMHCYSAMRQDRLNQDVRQYVKVIELVGSHAQCVQEGLKQVLLAGGGGMPYHSAEFEQQAVRASLERYQEVVLFCEIKTESRRKNLACITKGARGYLEGLQLSTTRIILLFKYEQPAKRFGFLPRRCEVPEVCCDWGKLQLVRQEDVEDWLMKYHQRNLLGEQEKQALMGRLMPLFDQNECQPYSVVLTALNATE